MFFDLNNTEPGFSHELFWQNGQLISAENFEKLEQSLLFHLHTKTSFFPFQWGILNLKTEINVNKLILDELALVMPNGQIVTHYNISEKLGLELPSPLEAPEESYNVYLICSRKEEFEGCQKEQAVQYKKWKPQLKLRLEESWEDAIVLLKIKKQKNVQLGIHWAEDINYIPPVALVLLSQDAPASARSLWERLCEVYQKIKKSIETIPHSKDIESRMRYQALCSALSEIEPYCCLPQEPYVSRIGFPPHDFYVACVRIVRTFQGVLGIPRQKGEVSGYAYNHNDLSLTFMNLFRDIHVLLERVISLRYREEEFVRLETNHFEAEVEPAMKYILVVENDMALEEVEGWIGTCKTGFFEGYDNIDIKGSSFGFQWERRKGIEGVSPSYRHVYLLKDGNEIVSYDRRGKLILRGARTPAPREMSLLFELKE